MLWKFATANISKSKVAPVGCTAGVNLQSRKYKLLSRIKTKCLIQGIRTVPSYLFAAGKVRKLALHMLKCYKTKVLTITPKSGDHQSQHWWIRIYSFT